MDDPSGSDICCQSTHCIHQWTTQEVCTSATSLSDNRCYTALILINTRLGETFDLKQHLLTADKYEVALNHAIDSLTVAGIIIDSAALNTVTGETIHDRDSLQTYPIMVSSGTQQEVFRRYPKVASWDLVNLSNQEIAEKYNVKGLWKKIEVAACGKTFINPDKVIDKMISNITWSFVLTLPLIGLLLLLVFRRKYPFLTQHLTFLTYLLCFVLIIVSIAILLAYFFGLPTGLPALIIIAVYAFVSFKDFYILRWWQCLLLTTLVSVASIAFTILALVVISMAIAFLS